MDSKRLIGHKEAEDCLKVWEICSGQATAAQALRSLTGLRRLLALGCEDDPHQNDCIEAMSNVHPDDLALVERYAEALAPLKENANADVPEPG
jgi:hypothetical protein